MKGKKENRGYKDIQTDLERAFEVEDAGLISQYRAELSLHLSRKEFKKVTTYRTEVAVPKNFY
jgi:hypothetical protein